MSDEIQCILGANGELGRGGFAPVYAGFIDRPKRVVAIKLFKTQHDMIYR